MQAGGGTNRCNGYTTPHAAVLLSHRASCRCGSTPPSPHPRRLGPTSSVKSGGLPRLQTGPAATSGDSIRQRQLNDIESITAWRQSLGRGQ